MTYLSAESLMYLVLVTFLVISVLLVLCTMGQGTNIKNINRHLMFLDMEKLKAQLLKIDISNFNKNEKAKFEDLLECIENARNTLKNDKKLDYPSYEKDFKRVFYKKHNEIIKILLEKYDNKGKLRFTLNCTSIRLGSYLNIN